MMEIIHPLMTLRDVFALSASEKDIEAFMWEKPEVPDSLHSVVWQKKLRTREQAMYAFADACMKAREE